MLVLSSVCPLCPVQDPNAAGIDSQPHWVSLPITINLPQENTSQAFPEAPHTDDSRLYLVNI